LSSIEFPDGSLDRLIELAVARILSTGQPILTQNASSFETYGTRLCHEVGGELDHIRFLLGHVSIHTTERYLACK
jgi:hypothetical protein